MGLARTYRFIEGGLVVLFFVQATRAVFGLTLSMLDTALVTHQVDLLLVNAHLMLLVAVVLPWFTPRVRGALPETLSIAAILAALARIGVSVQVPLLRIVAGTAVIGMAGVYFVALLRANWRTWASVVMIGLLLDQLLRARDAYDLSMRLWLDIPAAGLTIRIPWIAIQIGMSLIVVAVSRLARGNARRETYDPAYLTIWGGLAVGAFFAIETLVLAMPNVISRWAGVSYAGLVPWLLLVTALPLMPFVRRLMGETMAMFDDRLGGAVWLLLMVMLLVVGNRLPGLGAAGALIITQFMAALLIWWMPSPPDPAEVEQVGPSMSLALAVFIVLVYAYSLTFEYATVGAWLKGQGLIVVLVAAAVVALPRLSWREEDPWLLRPSLQRGVALAFVAPMVVLGLIVSGLGVDPVPPPLGTTLRIATYNVNGGYDATGAFQLELVARTIEASHADVVLLQEVDAGLPASYGIDEVQYLARRLDMSQAFLPTTEQVRGLAVLSRWPLSSRAGALFPGSSEQDGALSVSIRDAASGHSMTLVDAEFAPGTDEERVQQLAVLLSLVGDASPAVVGGSFSASPQDVVYQQLTGGGFADPDSVLGIEQGYTTPAVYPTVRYDYVLVRDLSPLDSRQVDSAASDHRLVVVEVGWSPD